MSPAASTSVPEVAPEERRRARKALASGASLGYELSSLTSAGPATIVPATLVAATLTHVFGGGIAVGVYLMVLCGHRVRGHPAAAGWDPGGHRSPDRPRARGGAHWGAGRSLTRSGTGT